MRVGPAGALEQAAATSQRVARSRGTSVLRRRLMRSSSTFRFEVVGLVLVGSLNVPASACCA